VLVLVVVLVVLVVVVLVVLVVVLVVLVVLLVVLVVVLVVSGQGWRCKKCLPVTVSTSPPPTRHCRGDTPVTTGTTTTAAVS